MGMLLLKPKVEANLLFYIKNEIQDQRVTVNTTSDIQFSDPKNLGKREL